MTKQLKVDVEKSLGYQANGRLKKENIENAKLSIKSFWCPNCQLEEKATKKMFGEDKKCPKCGMVMIQKY
jgi:Zn finger protein HypA/HybF involved in hydrogenase expression